MISEFLAEKKAAGDQRTKPNHHRDATCNAHFESGIGHVELLDPDTHHEERKGKVVFPV